MSQQENDGFKQTIASGGETSIPFDFKISDRAEIKIIRTRGGSNTTLVLNTDYTIADNQLNVDLGGVAVLIGSASPAVAADTYTCLLITPYSRGTLDGSSDFNQSGDFFAATVNKQLDFIVRMVNRLARDVGKSLKFDETLNIPVATLKSIPVDGQALVFQGTAGDVVGATFGSIANLTTVFTSLASGDFLNYNGTNWVNRKHLAAKGTPIASAATVDLGAADSDFIDLTGTATITSLGSTTTRNHVWVNCTGAMTFTHNGTSLIMPGAVNRTAAVGDKYEFVRISGSNWACVGYSLANGQALVAPATGPTIGTVVNTTSGSAIDFTGIPSTVKQIIVNIETVNQTVLGYYYLQIGDSGGIETTNYNSTYCNLTNASSPAISGGSGTEPAFYIPAHSGGGPVSGVMILTLLDATTNTWSYFSISKFSTTQFSITQGLKSLSATLDRVRFSVQSGAFNAGKINIQYI